MARYPRNRDEERARAFSSSLFTNKNSHHHHVTPDTSFGINHVIVSVHGLLARNLFETTETDITTRETTTSFAPHFQIMVTIGASTLTRYL